MAGPSAVYPIIQEKESSLFSHGLHPRAFTVFLFVLSRQGFPFSILPRVITDRPALLARSDLLINSLSRSASSGLLVEIFTHPLLLHIIIFTLLPFCNKISSIILFYGDRKVLWKGKRSTTKCRPLRQSRCSCAYGASDGTSLELQ